MKFSTKRDLAIRQLKENLSLLDRSIEALRYSYNKCSAVIEKTEYGPNEQESLEALTSRFARTSDILTQKLLKTFFYLINENPKTFLDAANLMEKIEIIDSADELLNIRELRNQIAHEYVIEDLRTLFKDVLKFVPELERILTEVRLYIDSKIVKTI